MEREICLIQMWLCHQIVGFLNQIINIWCTHKASNKSRFDCIYGYGYGYVCMYVCMYVLCTMYYVCVCVCVCVCM